LFVKYLNNKDIIINIFLICFSIYLIYYSFTIDQLQGALAETSPGLIPRLIGLFLLICNFILLVSSIKNTITKNKSYVIDDVDNYNKNVKNTIFIVSPRIIRIIITLSIIIIYRYVINILGFYISSIIFLVTMFSITKINKWWQIILISTVVTIIIGVFFKELLRIPLPDGYFFE